MKSQKYAEMVREKLGGLSNLKIEEKTGISNKRFSDYARGERQPDNYAIDKFAEILEMDANIIRAEIEAEWEKDERKKEFWSKKLRALGGMAASVAVLIVTLIMTNMVPAPAQAAPMLGSDFTKNQSIHYAKYSLWIRTIKRQLLLLLEKSKIGLCSMVACVCQPSA